MKTRQVKGLIFVIVGLAVLSYGMLLLLGLDTIALGKLSSAARDTNGAVLLVIFGAALTFYGLFAPSKE